MKSVVSPEQYIAIYSSATWGFCPSVLARGALQSLLNIEHTMPPSSMSCRELALHEEQVVDLPSLGERVILLLRSC